MPFVRVENVDMPTRRVRARWLLWLANEPRPNLAYASDSEVREYREWASRQTCCLISPIPTPEAHDQSPTD